MAREMARQNETGAYREIKWAKAQAGGQAGVPSDLFALVVCPSWSMIGSAVEATLCLVSNSTRCAAGGRLAVQLAAREGATFSGGCGAL